VFFPACPVPIIRDGRQPWKLLKNSLEFSPPPACLGYPARPSASIIVN
jgi:hypothetical protein